MKALRSNSPLLAVTPLRTPGFLSWKKLDGTSAARVRRTSPYKVGDVIAWRDVDRAGKPILRHGLVAAIRPVYQENSASWLPVYIARPARVDGGFAAAYVRVFPGLIQAGAEMPKT